MRLNDFFFMLLLFSKDTKHNIKVGGVKCLSTDGVQVPRNLPGRAGRCRCTGARPYSLCAEQAWLCCFSANGDFAPGNHRQPLLARCCLGDERENCCFCREYVRITIV